MVLSILAYHKEEINAMDDLGDVLVLLSCTNDRQLGKDWQAIIVFANDLVL